LLLAFAALAAFLHCAAGQAALVITSITRRVEVAATGGPPDSIEETTTGFFLGPLSTTGSSPAGEVTADAIQVSTTPDSVGTLMSGIGTIGSTAALTGVTGFSALADAIFDIEFTVNVAGLYAFNASVEWSGTSPPYGGFAVVELEDDAMNDLAIAMRDATSQGVDSENKIVSLSPGTTYHLLARSRIEGGGDLGAGGYGADASWDFELAVVPEAGSFLIMTPLALVAAWSAWRSRRVARA
jgi:hypothetical protein